MTVAELKRRLQPGTKLALVRAYWMAPGQPPVERTVLKVNSVDIIFASQPDFANGKQSHLSIPKASQLHATEKGFVIRDTGDNPDPKFELEYEWC
jgi:hypothetical protein